MGKVLGFWVYFQARLAEPSTHASIASLLALAGLNLDVGIVHDSLVALSIVFGGLGFFIKETAPLGPTE
jgi:hypothetical protein